MNLPEIIADLESAHKALRSIVDTMEDDYRLRKIETAQLKILLAIDQLGGILVLGSVVAPHELVGYKCECSLPFGAEAVVVRSNAPTVTEKLSVLIGGLFERFPHLYRLRIAEGKR